MTRRRNLVVLALDGLDWAFLQPLLDSGQAPFLTMLIEAGAWAPLAFAPPQHAESRWTSVATGVLADRHGILHPAERIGPAAFTRGVRAASVKAPTLWQIADAAGCPTTVIGWPATQGLTLEHGWVVAGGVEKAMGSATQAWPIPPDCVAPSELRHTVRALRLHPHDVDEGDLDLLIAPLSAPARDALAEGVAHALAECATLHALATDALSRRGPSVVAVRLGFVARIAALLARVASDPGASLCLARSYQFIDLCVGRYLGLAGRDADYALLSTGADVQLDGQFGDTAGFAVMAGPGLQKDAVLGPIDATDVLPTLLSILALPLPAHLDGVVVDEMFTAALAPSQREHPATPSVSHITAIARTPEAAFDPAPLQREGLAVPDFSGFIAVARQVECETLYDLAQVAVHRDDLQRATATLRELGARFPGFVPGRVLLAEVLLQAGEADGCEAIAKALPAVQADGVWADVAQGLIAFARHDWTTAAAAFDRLAHAKGSPLNARHWLGLIALHQQHWQHAADHFAVAADHAPRDLRVWQGLAEALSAQGRDAEAAPAWGRAVSLNPRSAKALLGWAEACARTGQPKRAAAARERALKLDPTGVGRRSVGT